MIPQYQFNLNADPLLTQNNGQPVDYATAIDNQIAQMQSIKQQLVDNRLQPPQNVVNPQLKQITLFDEINNEVSALTNSQKEILFKDKEYAQNEYEIQTLVQEDIKGKHFDEVYAEYEVSDMYSTNIRGVVVRGEVISFKEAEKSL